MARHNVTGKAGEDYACEYLGSSGYIVLIQNFKTKVGEIDIVAKDGSQYVFVEVKTRSSHYFGTPAEAITPKKLLSLVRAGEYYLLTNNIRQNYRIDAIEVDLTGSGEYKINHIKNITL
jgi:putative endonuclease